MFEQGSGLKISIPPVKFYVYFLYQGCDIVYIGKSVNPTQRIGAHISTKSFDSAECFELNSEDEMNKAEASLIVKHQPKLNWTFEAKKIGLTRFSHALKEIKNEIPKARKLIIMRKLKELTGSDLINVFGVEYISFDHVDMLIEELKK